MKPHKCKFKPGDKVICRQPGYYEADKIYTVESIEKTRTAPFPTDDYAFLIYIKEPATAGNKDWHYQAVFECVNHWTELEILLYG